MEHWKQINIYKHLVNEIKHLATTVGGDQAILKAIAAAEKELASPPVCECRFCSDTGYEDVRGQCPCRNRCNFGRCTHEFT